MSDKPKARLTIERHQEAINKAVWIDASPHEWPTSDDVWLLCNALLDSVVMVDHLMRRIAELEGERDAHKADAGAFRDLAYQVPGLKAERDAAKAEAEKYRAGETRAVEVVQKLLKSAVPNRRDHPTMWDAWAFATKFLEGNPPALDWLAQVKREAAAAWIEKEALGYRDRIGEYYESSVQGMLDEAAALRAGKGDL